MVDGYTPSKICAKIRRTKRTLNLKMPKFDKLVKLQQEVNFTKESCNIYFDLTNYFTSLNLENNHCTG